MNIRPLTVSTRPFSTFSKLSEKVKSKIDHCAPGTLQKGIDTTKSIGFAFLQLPITAANILNSARHAVSPATTFQNIPKTEDQQHTILYRAITSAELEKLLSNAKGPLFDLPQQTDTPPSSLTTFLHISGTRGYDKERILTSFSEKKEIAYKFAYPEPTYGAVATFHIPTACLIQNGQPGSTYYEEILMPTARLDLTMVASVEIRTGEELRTAKLSEISSMGSDSRIMPNFHDFTTVPAIRFSPQDETQRLASQKAFTELQETEDKILQKEDEAALAEYNNSFLGRLFNFFK